MNAPRNSLTPLELERLLLAEQANPQQSPPTPSNAEHARLLTRLRAEDRAQRSTLFTRLPPDTFAARVVARARTSATDANVASARRASEARRHPGLSWSLAAVVGTLAIALFANLPQPNEQSLSSERAKGLDLELRIYRKLDTGVEQLSQGSSVASHQVLQLGYINNSYAYGVLISIDGSGTVTLHQPSDSNGSSVLASEPGQHVLPEAYELDDAPQFERFIFVGSHEPVPVQRVLDAAKQLASSTQRARSDRLPLPERFVQRSVLLLKPSAR
jgi:hypothetical protein